MSGTRPGAQPHHRGAHQRLARELVQAANRNPHTQCQADGCKGWGRRTLAEHPNTKTGRKPRWTAGHKVPGKIAHSINDYRPEVDVCGYSDGATLRNTRRQAEPHTEQW